VYALCSVYVLEACPINKTQEKSLEFTINRVLMKIFRTVSVDVIDSVFGIPDIKVLVVKRKKKFLMKYANSANGLVSCLAMVLCQSSIVKCIFCFIYCLFFYYHTVFMVK